MRFDTFYRYQGASVHVEKWHVQEYQLHIHSDIELQLILNGSVDCHTSHRIYALHQGDILLTNRKQPHALVLPSQNCTAVWLAINPSFCSAYFPALSTIRFQEVFFHREHPLNAQLNRAILDIYDCYHQDAAHCAFLLHETLNHIFYLLLSRSRHTQLSEAEVNLERRNEQRITQIIDFVEHNYAMQPRLEDLAQRMGLSPDYLSHFIRDTLGVTYREYLTHIRLRHALELLQSRTITQLDLLLQTGFSDYRYFQRAFKRVYGCAPGEYLAAAPQANP